MQYVLQKKISLIISSIIFGIIVSNMQAAGNLISLTLREQYGIKRIAAPVTSGVPLPDGGITSINNLKLLKKIGSNYVEVPAQFKILSRWHAKPTDPSAYIKWVLLDFQTDVDVNSNHICYLEYGTEVMSAAIPSTPITTIEDQNQIIINTGTAQFKIKKSGFNLFNSVLIDGKELVISSAHQGSVIKDSYNVIYCGANNVKKAIIEESGPLRTVILVKGQHGNDAGTDNEFYGYTTRLHFYAGKTFIKVSHTLTNNPLMPVSEQPARGALAFKDFSLVTQLNFSSGPKSYMVYGASEIFGDINDDGNVYLYQDSDGSDTWNSSTKYNELYSNTHFRGYKIFKNGIELENKNRALGIVDLSDSEKGLTVGVNQFWQLFPKKIKVEGNGKVVVGILPEDFTQNEVNYHWIEDMSQINTEIFYNFHIGPYNQTIRDEIIDRIHPLFAVALPSWYSQTKSSSLPGGDIYHYKDGIAPRILPGDGDDYWITIDQMNYPLINPMKSLYETRSIQGIYSAYYYGPRQLSDKNGYNFEGPVEHFINFMQIGIIGNSGDKFSFYSEPERQAQVALDYNLLNGGIDFTKHWMYTRATNLPEGWEREDYGIITRKNQVAYWFVAGYPRWGGRVGSDLIHTRNELKPTLYNKGRTQPSRDWFFMDTLHITLNHIVDYYHLTGDMATLEYAHSAGELLENYLPEDIRKDGILDTPPSSGEAIRGEAWPILGLLHVYDLTGDNQYLNYAIEGAKKLMAEQNLEKGYHTTSELMSFAQFSKAILAFARLYELTENEEYIDRASGYMNFLLYYVAAPNGFLSGYICLDENGNTLLYPEAIKYYNTYKHQPQNALTGLSSSSSRLYFPLAWLYRQTGDNKYKWILDINYDSVTNGKPSWMTNSAWLQTYLVERFINPKTDKTPPNKITDLSFSPTAKMGEIKLEWTAPKDDSTLLKYQVKYAELPMEEQIVYPDDVGIKTNFWAATNVKGEPVPSSAGSKQSMTISGLDLNKTYYFAIRAYDTSSNRNEISNQLSINYDTNGFYYIATTSLPESESMSGQLYSQTLQVTGGNAPYNWAVTSGVLPKNLSLNSSNGIISGTSFNNGDYTLFINVTDSSNPAKEVTKEFTLKVSGTDSPPSAPKELKILKID